jgi:PAS domain S-box-containing protein
MSSETLLIAVIVLAVVAVVLGGLYARARGEARRLGQDLRRSEQRRQEAEHRMRAVGAPPAVAAGAAAPVAPVAEPPVRDSEARFRAAMDASLDAVILADADGRITDCNAAAEALLGKPRVALVGQDFARTAFPQNVRDRQQAALGERLLPGSHGAGRPLDVVIVAGGKDQPAQLGIARLGREGRTGFAVHIRDLSTSRQKEGEHEDLAVQFREMQKRRVDLEAQLRAAQKGRDELEGQVRELRERVAAAPTAAAPAPAAAPAEAGTGHAAISSAPAATAASGPPAAPASAHAVPAPAAAPAAAASTPAAPPASAPAAGATGLTVLLAEDEDDVRRVIAQTVRDAGFTVLEAAQGAQALEVARGHGGAIHLLLTDLVMPVMGGRQLAQRMIALQPALKILYVSGHVDESAAREAITGDHEDFLAKPFEGDALVDAIQRLLQTPAR